MGGYSKIKHSGSRKSKSPDFSDLPSPPQQSPKPFCEIGPRVIPKTKENREAKPTNGFKDTHNFGPDAGEEGERGERFGEILNRARSVSSASRRYRYDNNEKTGSIQSAMRRAFSMSRSSSAAERYSRIHDQELTLGSSPSNDDGGENGGDLIEKKMKKKNRGGRILKACKSLFRI